jgi:hypothetical protein
MRLEPSLQTTLSDLVRGVGLGFDHFPAPGAYAEKPELRDELLNSLPPDEIGMVTRLWKGSEAGRPSSGDALKVEGLRTKRSWSRNLD